MELVQVATSPSASPSIGKLAEALAAAQATIEDAPREHTAKVKSDKGSYEYSYSSLAAVWGACRKALTANKIAVVQSTLNGHEPAAGQAVTVRTVLMHASGEWIAGELTMRTNVPGPQAMGSLLTYARRYALSAMVGIAPADDDGDGAETKPGQPTSAPTATASAPAKARQYTIKTPPPATTDDPEPAIDAERQGPISEGQGKLIWARTTELAKELKLSKNAVDAAIAAALEDHGRSDRSHVQRGELDHVLWSARQHLRATAAKDEQALTDDLIPF